MRRTSMSLAAAALAGGLAVAGCGNSLQLGAAATTNQGRITAVTLTSHVASLDAAFKADAKKGITPQAGTGNQPQQVLSWLLRFQAADKLAALHGLTVTPADVQAQVRALNQAAAQQRVTTAQYISAAGGVPPDLLQQLARYFATQLKFQNRLDGGTAPTGQQAQARLQQRVTHAQCLAATKLNIQVNPQYGAFDYASLQVVTVPSKLAADGGPSPSGSPTAKPRLTPGC